MINENLLEALVQQKQEDLNKQKEERRKARNKRKAAGLKGQTVVTFSKGEVVAKYPTKEVSTKVYPKTPEEAKQMKLAKLKIEQKKEKKLKQLSKLSMLQRALLVSK